MHSAKDIVSQQIEYMSSKLIAVAEANTVFTFRCAECLERHSFDKAHWDDPNMKIYCEVCAKKKGLIW